MRKFLVEFLFMCVGAGLLAAQVRTPGPGGAGSVSTFCAPVSGYAHCRQLTINHTQVGGSTLSAFGVLVKATLGASRIQNANCYDVVFTSDSAGANLIPWEQQSCVQSSGAIVDWVGLPLVSASANTLFYVSYDKVGVNTPQNIGTYSAPHVWDSNYKLVQHLGNGVTLSVADSTALTTPSNSGATATAGNINGAAATNNTTPHYIDDPITINYAQLSVEIWVNPTGAPGPDRVAANDHTDANYKGFQIHFDSGPPLFDVGNGSAVAEGATTTTLAVGSWTHLAGTYDGAQVRVYQNGVAGSGAQALTGSVSAGGYDVWVGGWPPNPAYGFNGSVAEFRISNTARPAGWILAEYNNQVSGSTFVTVGGEI